MHLIADLQTAKNENQKYYYDLELLNLSGMDVGLMVFDFKCKKSSSIEFEISWNNTASENLKLSAKGKNGTLIVFCLAAPQGSQ